MSSQGNIEEEDSGAISPGTSASQGQVAIDEPSSEEEEEDSGSKETSAEPTAGKHGENLGSNEADASPKTSAILGQVTIDEPTAEEEDDDWGSKETSASQGQVTVGEPTAEQEDLGSEEKEQCSGVASADTSASQGQITIDEPTAEKHVEDLGSKETEGSPGTSASPGQATYIFEQNLNHLRKCWICKRPFYTKGVIIHHNSQVHHKLRKEKNCKICGTVFTGNAQLLEHQTLFSANGRQKCLSAICPSD